MRCDRCGVVYLDPRPVRAELTTIYPDHYHAFTFTEDRFGFVYRVRRRLEARRLLAAAGSLPPDARILDVGCGDGFHLDCSWPSSARRAGSSKASTSTHAPPKPPRLRGVLVHRGSIEDLDLEAGCATTSRS